MKRAFVMILICIAILVFPLSCSTNLGSISTPMGQASVTEQKLVSSYGDLQPEENARFYTVKLQLPQPVDLDAVQEYLWISQGNMALQAGANTYPCSYVIYEAPKSDHTSVSVRFLFQVDGSAQISSPCTIALSDGSTISLPGGGNGHSE